VSCNTQHDHWQTAEVERPGDLHGGEESYEKGPPLIIVFQHQLVCLYTPRSTNDYKMLFVGEEHRVNRAPGHLKARRAHDIPQLPKSLPPPQRAVSREIEGINPER